MFSFENSDIIVGHGHVITKVGVAIRLTTHKFWIAYVM